MSDDELKEEAARRRKARKRGKKRPDDAYAKKILQFYANLELEVGASEAEIEEAYARLMKKYHPSRHAGDAAKQRAAEGLVASLTRAYEGLRAHRERS